MKHLMIFYEIFNEIPKEISPTSVPIDWNPYRRSAENRKSLATFSRSPGRGLRFDGPSDKQFSIDTVFRIVPVMRVQTVRQLSRPFLVLPQLDAL